ncbi:hypothetical protein [Streptomyces sp. PTY087I2]|uniref:hypothetical protein n=1 Tax=Streptomyces sp. PTY087I2 TaxID=1819298 RepID=UPI00114CE896|nr:hypothetical protein [Streptomyces sp. PTY087I2]
MADVPNSNGTGVLLIVARLVIAGLVFSAWFGLAQSRASKLAMAVVRGSTMKGTPKGELNHFHALTAPRPGS